MTQLLIGIILSLTLFSSLSFSYSTSEQGFLQLQIQITSADYSTSKMQKKINQKIQSLFNITKHLSHHTLDCQHDSRVFDEETTYYKKSQVEEEDFKILKKYFVYQICSLDSLLFLLNELQSKDIWKFKKLSWKQDTKQGYQQLLIYEFLPKNEIDVDTLLKLKRVSQFANYTISERNKRITRIQNKQADQAQKMLIVYHQIAVKKELQKFAIDLKQLFLILQKQSYQIYTNSKHFLGQSNTNHLYMSQVYNNTKNILSQSLKLKRLKVSFEANNELSTHFNDQNNQKKSWVQIVHIQQLNGKNVQSSRVKESFYLDKSKKKKYYYTYLNKKYFADSSQIKIYLRSAERNSIDCQKMNIQLFYQ